MSAYDDVFLKTRQGRWYPLGVHAAEWWALSPERRRTWLDGPLYRIEKGSDGGKLWMPDRTVELDSAERERVIRRMLHTAPVFDPSAPEARRRAYIPGLWNHGTVPAFIGPKGWGKTELLCPLVAALIIPGARFLDAFEPAELTDDERRRDVWLINSESPVADVHETLLENGLVFGFREGMPVYTSPQLGLDGGCLIVEHLTMRGGPRRFDLSDPAKVAEWVPRLIEYGDRQAPPLTVIADGVTAITGNDTARHGAFTSAFKDVLRQVGTPNGLGVLHSPMDPRVNTPMGGVESMAEWDGLWIAESPRHPILSTTPRYLSVLPRMRGPRLEPRRRIVMIEGRLRMLAPGGDDAAADAAPAVPGAPADDLDVREALLERLRPAGEAGLWTKEVCGTGGDYTANKPVLEALERDGLVISENVRKGRMSGTRWRLAME